MRTILNNGVTMPLLGLGCWDMRGDEAQHAVESALQIGYRLIDTASMYGNEKEVGFALGQISLPRDEVFITTKIHNFNQGYESTMKAYDVSCKLLNLDFIDLYMVHWPLKDTRTDTWKALEKLYLDGRVRAIGVCNYLPYFLEELDPIREIMPVVNQCEFSPYLFDLSLLQACQSRSIVLQAWSPLLRGKRFNDPKLIAMATKYSKTPAQILIRWSIDHNISTIPKSSSPQRLKENFDVFDFSISVEDLVTIDEFNENYRMSGEDPMKFK